MTQKRKKHFSHITVTCKTKFPNLVSHIFDNDIYFHLKYIYTIKVNIFLKN